VRPNVSIQCCHLGPPRSFLRRYFNCFCLLCTSNLRFLLLCLSFLPRDARKSAIVLIFAVRIAIWTSDDPVSGPTRCSVAAMLVSARIGCTVSLRFRSGGARGGKIMSVLCRPNVSMQRVMLTRMRSLLEPFCSARQRARDPACFVLQSRPRSSRPRPSCFLQRRPTNKEWWWSSSRFRSAEQPAFDFSAVACLRLGARMHS
jgi:hypothetical protein